MMKQGAVTQESGVLTLLRICTVLLAVVSFWSTAQGMKEYTFPDGWQAYAASLGIQGLLLGLNFSLPTFLRYSRKNGQKIMLVLLSTVVLVCSSWFSYLYIAQWAYGDSWDTERRLAAQEVYREQLFDADDYIERYQRTVELSLADEVTALYDQAVAMDANKIDVNEHLDWTEERERYAPASSAAADIMNQVIDAMEDATDENATQATREQATSILTALQETLQGRIDAVEPRIDTATANVGAASSRLQLAQTNLRNAPNDTDLTPYINAVTNAAQNYDYTLAQLTRLEQERGDYQDALQRVAYYLTTLGMAQDGVSTYYIGADLREIQNELFQTDPDSERMQTIAAEIFNRLQSAVDLGSASEEADGDYQALLSQMNRFMQNLTRYGELKDAKATLQPFIERLADGKTLPIDASAQSGGWQAEWVAQFDDLKAVISGLPVYTADTAADTDSSLLRFDRTAVSSALDRAIRNYLTKHNPAQQGLIYLESPYKGLAIFSMFLAFLFDIAAFVTGVIIDSMSFDRSEREDKTERNDMLREIGGQAPAWAVTHGMNRYLFLTGDYNYLDGVATYRAIEDGEETKVDLPDLNHAAGFYRWENGNVAPVIAAGLLFKGEANGPQDGVYQSCTLTYNSEHLILDQGVGKSLGSIDPHTPVYQFTNDEFEVAAARDLGGISAKTAVVALNADGTRIAAVYMLLR